MTKSELIERIVTQQGLLSSKDVELAIKTMLEQMAQALATGERIEIRGFGSFSLHYRAPRVGRNPKTGQSVSLDGKCGVRSHSNVSAYALKCANSGAQVTRTIIQDGNVTRAHRGSFPGLLGRLIMRSRV